MSMESHVKARYAQGAQAVEAELCCPVDYDADLLKLLPDEIVERDYGCGDPSRYVRENDIVLDLGSGGGKICYMAAQLVGEDGHVIGVDMNDAMLDLARRHQDEMAEKLGGHRVTFLKGRIQDLTLGLDDVAEYLAANPVKDLESAEAFRQWEEEMRDENPLIPDDSVDLVISNCVLNLVDDRDKQQMIEEIYRVLKPGGRVAISDIVSDIEVPDDMRDDPELWSGCISGAFEESAFVEAFQDAGFAAVGYDKWDLEPWRVVEGIEFRSVTLTAIKAPLESLTDGGHAVIYKGPFVHVSDELGNVFSVGKRVAVAREVYERLGEAPYAEHFIRLEPSEPWPDDEPFLLEPGTLREPGVNRGGGASMSAAEAGGSCCAPKSSHGSGCC
ncbi:methyltransferase domain-containing protein [Magnetofaba australis]|uniref:Arsenite methyltransferase n=1 Tax=Magnetofaba australis IT-1 TaxID=1434232 RepID=A0A1Y2K3J0_9PROT|nr:methyltransferase domain-containing protein [Magnetofaba australis]OSM02196.1 putative type 11 methyltransferase [Magnetofaba australis IT-1]